MECYIFKGMPCRTVVGFSCQISRLASVDLSVFHQQCRRTESAQVRRGSCSCSTSIFVLVFFSTGHSFAVGWSDMSPETTNPTERLCRLLPGNSERAWPNPGDRSICLFVCAIFLRTSGHNGDWSLANLTCHPSDWLCRPGCANADGMSKAEHTCLYMKHIYKYIYKTLWRVSTKTEVPSHNEPGPNEPIHAFLFVVFNQCGAA
jgi:hypothetical protein